MPASEAEAQRERRLTFAIRSARFEGPFCLKLKPMWAWRFFKATKEEVIRVKALRLWIWIVLSFFISMLAGCGGGGSSSSSVGSGTGTLSVSLLDATTDEYNAVYVTIEEVQVHKGENGNWKVVASPWQTYNLLELVNGVREQLGIAELETGHYTQMRMIIGKRPDDGINILSEPHRYANYIIDKSNEYHELKIPSGLQTGIKIVHGFDISENQTTELILDFDASESVVKAGSSGQWLLKPTIKVLDTKECSIISGIVEFDGTAIEGALVSAQIYDPDVPDPKDMVVVQASTSADETGSYTIFLQPGTYNIVAYKDEYDADCAELVAAPNTSYTQDFVLSTASTGTVSGSVIIDGGTDVQHATISFRQLAQCEGSSEEEQIQVKSLNVANGGSYNNVLLPEGTYTVVASTFGRTTQEFLGVKITAGADTRLDVIFP